MDSSCRLTHHAVAIENSLGDADWLEMAILPTSGAHAQNMGTKRELHMKDVVSPGLLPSGSHRLRRVHLLSNMSTYTLPRGSRKKLERLLCLRAR